LPLLCRLKNLHFLKQRGTWKKQKKNFAELGAAQSARVAELEAAQSARTPVQGKRTTTTKKNNFASFMQTKKSAFFKTTRNMEKTKNKFPQRLFYSFI
jgi:hypothetical protein